MAEVLVNKHKLDLVPISDVNKYDLNDYQAVILGAAIRYGKHSKLVVEFVDKNRDKLTKIYSVFFSVNAVARKADKSTAKTNPYVQKFIKKTKWRPTRSSVFGGSINYPEYRFFDKFVIRLIMWLTNGPTNIQKSYEFTDWDKVVQLASEISIDIIQQK
tara:strand:+ start:449 stop:925 length:477 start_codon:yes stop_codon:yes gene_type:complete